MDINKIQKLNDMALNLKRHNVVFSQDEALHQAENIYGQENDYSKETVMEHHSESEDLKKEVRKLTFALQNTMNELRDLKMHVGKMEQDFNDARVNQTPRRMAAEHQPAMVRQQTIQQQMQDEPQQLVPQKEQNRPIDRNNVAPSEVSIEKFFYCGTK